MTAAGKDKNADRRQTAIVRRAAHLLLGQRRKQCAVQDPLRELLHGKVLALFAIQVEEIVIGQESELHLHGGFPSLHPESRQVGHRDHFHLRQALPLAVALLPYRNLIRSGSSTMLAESAPKFSV